MSYLVLRSLKICESYTTIFKTYLDKLQIHEISTYLRQLYFYSKHEVKSQICSKYFYIYNGGKKTVKHFIS